MRNRITLLLTAFTLLAGTLIAAGNIPVGGTLQYKATGPTGTWEGINSTVSGDMTLDPLNGKVCIQMKSWDSKNTRRDNHARDMFEVDQFPEACYTVKSVSGTGEGITVTGELELHGVRKSLPVTGNLVLSSGGVQFTGSTTIKIEDFGMTRPAMMGMKVQNDVPVSITVKGGKIQ